MLMHVYIINHMCIYLKKKLTQISEGIVRANKERQFLLQESEPVLQDALDGQRLQSVWHLCPASFLKKTGHYLLKLLRPKNIPKQSSFQYTCQNFNYTYMYMDFKSYSKIR